jgi:hypothetical protein
VIVTQPIKMLKVYLERWKSETEIVCKFTHCPDNQLTDGLWNAFVKYLSPELGAHGSVVLKALCYKLEGRGLDTWWGDFFQFT